MPGKVVRFVSGKVLGTLPGDPDVLGVDLVVGIRELIEVGQLNSRGLPRKALAPAARYSYSRA
jgi:hypothetical protein